MIWAKVTLLLLLALGPVFSCTVCELAPPILSYQFLSLPASGMSGSTSRVVEEIVPRVLPW